MGVTGLWNLIEPCSSPVPLQSLEGKILAVDVSIWIYQAVKGFQDKHGAALPNAHLIGLFYRLCKLLYYRVKPIFVFDGCVPQLKLETIARRHMQRSKVRGEADRIQGLLLQSLAKERVVHRAFSSNPRYLLLKSSKGIEKNRSLDDIFKLPEMPEEIKSSRLSRGEGEQSDSEIYLNDSTKDYSTTTTEDSLFGESNPYHNYNINLQCIDVRSEQFKELPADVRHDILVDIKETRKESSWGRLHELPEKSDDFSSFQMKRLLKRRAVQESIEEVEKEMGGCSLTYNELKKVFTKKGIVEGAKQICSNENTRFLLVSDLEQVKLTTQNQGPVAEEHSKLIEKPRFSQELVVATREAETDLSVGLDDGLNIDMELAVALSLEKPTACVIEYEGMLNDELIGDHSIGQSMDTATKSEASESIDNTARKISAPESSSELTNVTDSEIDLISTSETDSDLGKEFDRRAIEQNICISKVVEIVLDPTKPLTPQDDFSSDIFNEKITHLKEHIHSAYPVFRSNIHSNTNLITQNIKAAHEFQKASDINKITLDDISIFSSPTEISDDNNKNYTTNREISVESIKISDVDCSKQKLSLQMPQVKTPREIKKCSEYAKTDVMECIPKQQTTENDVRKTKPLVFVNKTKTLLSKEFPMSDSNPTLLLKDRSKDSKSLFPTTKVKLNQVISTKTEDVLNQATDMLNQKRNTDILINLASSIAQENKKLKVERNRQDRMALSISERMNYDCQELLSLFGIPYIVAPMEAEAQCAFLDAMHFTNGTITDDSDIWLFGGRTVYKNFFAQNKHVLEFRADNIEKVFNCDRSKLIEMACLVGSDYTSGIHGIGAVTAMEILSTFSSKKGEQDTSLSTIISTLTRFRDWWIDSKATSSSNCSTRPSLLKKLKNIQLHEGFPNIAVIEAYLSPKIDDNTENFTWGYPNIESIREFTRKTFGWTMSKTDAILMPVTKKMNEKKSQATIKNYFSIKNASSLKQTKLSRRVKIAIENMSDKVQENVVKLKRPALTKREIKPKRKKQTKKNNQTSEKK